MTSVMLAAIGMLVRVCTKSVIWFFVRLDCSRFYLKRESLSIDLVLTYILDRYVKRRFSTVECIKKRVYARVRYKRQLNALDGF